MLALPIKFDLLPPAQYESGVVNWVAQSFIRIQQALGKASGLSVSSTEPGDPATGDIWVDTTTKTVKIYTGAEFMILGSYESVDYSPLLLQPGAFGRTVVSATYQYSGDYIIGEISLSVTGTGNANTAISVSMPVAGVAAAAGQCVGHGYIYDASAGTRIPLQPVIVGTNFLLGDATQAIGVALGQNTSAFNAALVNTDAILFNFRYRWR